MKGIKMNKLELIDKIFELRATWTEEDMLVNGYRHSGDMITKLNKYSVVQLQGMMKRELEKLYKDNVWEKK